MSARLRLIALSAVVILLGMVSSVSAAAGTARVSCADGECGLCCNENEIEDCSFHCSALGCPSGICLRFENHCAAEAQVTEIGDLSVNKH